MSKYDIGDEFVIRIGDIFNNYVQGSGTETNHLYKIRGFNSLVFDDNGLDKLQKVKVVKELAIPYNEAYNKGLEDAWELARKIGKMPCEVGTDIFGYNYVWEAIENHTPQETLAKLEAYEKAQEEIEIGDVVVHLGTKDVVIDFVDSTDDEMVVLTKNGCVEEWKHSQFTKTGKHIDISSILEQIGGGE